MTRLEAKLEKIASDGSVTAKTVGLRYCVNCDKGFYRIRNKTGFHYIDETNDKVQSKEILERISKLVIPPAWENVWISPYENGHLQATGIDAKGRKQYRYHANWSKIRNQSKFYRLQNFADTLPKIRKQVEKDLARNGLPYEKVVALVIKLIEITNIRIGNEAYKKLYGSFGITTMQDKHIKFVNSEMFFEFTGKKGIKHKIKLSSKKLANLVQKCKDIPGQDLFQYYDYLGNRKSIGSTDINNYLKKITNQDFTAKDFRVWAGSVNALNAFQQSKSPETASETKHKIIEVLDEVASKLGNTRTVCKKYYVHPNVIAAYEKGSIWNYSTKRNTDRFSSPEYSLVKLLKKETTAEVYA
jgi:DNA topoisomerase-1